MNETTYYPPRNYETSHFKLWIECDASTNKYWREQAHGHYRNAMQRGSVQRGFWTRWLAARSSLAEQLQLEFDRSRSLGRQANVYAHLLHEAVSHVNWHEVAEMVLTWVVDTTNQGLDSFPTYPRAAEIESGVLIDVSNTAKKANIETPVMMTPMAWSTGARVQESNAWHTDEERLCEILDELHTSLGSGSIGTHVLFTVSVDVESHQERIHFRAICGPGESGAPVITIMLERED